MKFGSTSVRGMVQCTVFNTVLTHAVVLKEMNEMIIIIIIFIYCNWVVTRWQWLFYM